MCSGSAVRARTPQRVYTVSAALRTATRNRARASRTNLRRYVQVGVLVALCTAVVVVGHNVAVRAV